MGHQDHASLSKVSKQCHRVVAPYLYCHIRVTTVKAERAYPEHWLTSHGWATLWEVSPQTVQRWLTILVRNISFLILSPTYCQRLDEALLRNSPGSCDRLSSEYRILGLIGGEVQPTKTREASGAALGTPFRKLSAGYCESRSSSNDFPQLKQLDTVIYDMSVSEPYHVLHLPIETLNFLGGSMEPVLATRADHNRLNAGWNFVNKNIEHLAFKGAMPPEKFLGFIELAKSGCCLE